MPRPVPADSIATPGAGLADDGGTACPTFADTTRPSARPRAITYSDAYYTRLTIHRIGSYAMLPLFVTEYILGQKLINDSVPSSGLKTAHGLVAGGIAVVFAVVVAVAVAVFALGFLFGPIILIGFLISQATKRRSRPRHFTPNWH
jgi:hypothetical protein